jgi:putative membrane protein
VAVTTVIDLLGPLLLAVVAYAYAWRARTLAERGAPVPVWREVCFGASLLLLAVTDIGPLAGLAEDLVLAHMVQHLIVMDLAAVLFVLGLTGPLLQPLLAIRWLGWLRALANPLVALPLWALDLYLWHLSALYNGVLDSAPLHLLQHACFLGFGIAMWMPVLGPLPRPRWFGFGAQLGYVIVVRLLGAVLANVLIWSGSPLYGDYAAGEAAHGISPLTDQGIAGTIMMIESGLLTIGLLAYVVLRWAQQDSERQRLIDLAQERGVPLDDARAARAVAAGEGARLEERLKGT